MSEIESIHTGQRHLRTKAIGNAVGNMPSFLQTPDIVDTPSVLKLWTTLFRGNILQLFKLALVNVAITFTSEVFLREFVYKSVFQSSHVSLFTAQGGLLLLNKQVFINCLMSFFASLFGGVAYFLIRRKNRWLYFVGFGVTNSALCQILAALFLPYTMSSFLQRLVFDSIYSATLRFGSFEIFRKPILKSSFRLAPLFGWRLAQDFMLSALRIAAIIMAGLSSQ